MRYYGHIYVMLISADNGVQKVTYRTREGNGRVVKAHMGNLLVHYVIVKAVSNEIRECVINKMGIHLYTHHYRLW